MPSNARRQHESIALDGARTLVASHPWPFLFAGQFPLFTRIHEIAFEGKAPETIVEL